jgi:hypothetical protein
MCSLMFIHSFLIRILAFRYVQIYYAVCPSEFEVRFEAQHCWHAKITSPFLLSTLGVSYKRIDTTDKKMIM